MFDKTIKEMAFSRWQQWAGRRMEDPELSAELKALSENPEELFDHFYRDLEFGTGGLRGLLGAGTNRMNLYTVAKATKGYADYLNQKFSAPSVAIAYDSRIKSDLFARTAAEVFARNGVGVFIFRKLAPTPALSFAVRYLRCSGGIVITASHNPARYNGYKVYGADGCQITTQTAAEILAKIQKTDIFRDTIRADFDSCAAAGRIAYIGEDVITAYLNAVSAQAFRDETAADAAIAERTFKNCTAKKHAETGPAAADKMAANPKAVPRPCTQKDVSIVYTPLNGTGLYYVTRALRENGFTNVMVVREQEQPDGHFPTCPCPNPEIREALELGIACARANNSDLLLATDPDGDRVGTAVKSGDAAGGYVLLTGNEMGLLLFDYICKRRTALGIMPESPVLIKTIVTTELAEKIADDYGVKVIDVLTGFKFIGEQIGMLEEKKEADRYIFGFEESCGYLSGGYVRDKDGVNASLLICEMLAWHKARGKSLLEVLNGLYERYGYCLNTLHSYTFEGAEGFVKMERIMGRLRTECPDDLAGKKRVSFSDYQESVTHYQDGEREPILLPKSNVIKIGLEGGSSVVARPSGTEPKLKLYFSVSGAGRKEAEQLEIKMARDMEQLLR